jgi:hypothetical protein
MEVRMRAFRLGFLTAAVLLLGLALAPQQAARADAEDGSTPFDGVWDVSVMPDAAGVQAGKEAFDDEVLFESGHFMASACSKYGFAPADFAVNGSSFSTTLSGDEGTIVWSGTMTAGGFSGTVVWSKPSGEVFTYTLSGTRHQNSGDEVGS